MLLPTYQPISIVIIVEINQRWKTEEAFDDDDDDDDANAASASVSASRQNDFSRGKNDDSITSHHRITDVVVVVAATNTQRKVNLVTYVPIELESMI